MTTLDYSKRSEYEAQTYKMLDAYLSKPDRNQAAYLLAYAIRACWANSMGADRWLEIAACLSGFPASEAMRRELTQMVREGLLRGRNERRTRVYEVNY